MKVFLIVLFYYINVILCRKHFTEFKVPKDNSPSTPLDAVWQPVFGTKKEMFVYSAYADKRESNLIRVIGIKRYMGDDKVICRIWMMNNKNFTVPGIVEKMAEFYHGLNFMGAFVFCLLNTTKITAEETIQSSVSIVSAIFPTRPYTNRIIIRNTGIVPSTLNNIHVCVQPIHSDFNRSKWLIEWLEFNKLLGIKEVHLYKESVDTRVDCILREYEKTGFVSYLNWTLPIPVKEHIWSYGQTVALNDCLYRTMSKTGWMLNIDLDELVVPSKSKDYKQLIKDLTRFYIRYNNTDEAMIGEVFIKNVFFYLGWKDGPQTDVDLITAKKIRASLYNQNNMTAKNRNKYMVRPFNVFELGIHHSSKLITNAVSTCAPRRMVVMHHYRVTCVNETARNCLRLPSLIDNTAQRWSIPLIIQVQRQRTFLAETCFESANYTWLDN